MDDNKSMMQSYYVSSSRPRYRLYAALLVIGLIIAGVFVFASTESSIDTISKKYPERAQLSNDNDAENVAYVMQNLFTETGLLLDQSANGLP